METVDDKPYPYGTDPYYNREPNNEAWVKFVLIIVAVCVAAVALRSWANDKSDYRECNPSYEQDTSQCG